MAPSGQVSVLVVTYNHADEIDACLDAALAQSAADLPVEVVVVDNASRDGTVERVTARGDAVRLVALEANRGFAAGMNAAFAASAGDLVLFLNPDCVMDAGCATALRDHLAARPRVGLAAALLRELDGTPQLFARRQPRLAASVWAFTGFGRRIDTRWRGGRGVAHRRYEDLWADGPPTEPASVDCPAAACVMARRADLEPRPFDERFPLLFNDGDLCLRLQAAGRGIEVVPAAGAAHGYGTSLRRAGEADVTAMRAEWVASLVRYADRHWSPPERVGLRAVLLADVAFQLALRAAGRQADAGHVRGTLGGLGLPGGRPPLLSAPLRAGWR